MAKTEKLSKLPVRKETETAPAPTGPFTEMDRLFERLMGHALGRHWLRPWGWELPAELGLEAGFPRVDVIDRDEEIVVRAEVPGVDRDDLDVSMTDDTVTIRGKVEHEARRDEEGEYFYHETRRGAFARTVRLPARVDGAKAKATYRDGVVELSFPKPEAARRRRIPIED